MLLSGDWATTGCMQEEELGELTSIGNNQTLVDLNERAWASGTLNQTSTMNVTSGSPTPGLVTWLHTRLLIQNQSTNASLWPRLLCLCPGLFCEKLGVGLHRWDGGLTELYLSMSSTQRPLGVQASHHLLISLPLSAFYKYLWPVKDGRSNISDLCCINPDSSVTFWACIKRCLSLTVILEMSCLLCNSLYEELIFISWSGIGRPGINFSSAYSFCWCNCTVSV